MKKRHEPNNSVRKNIDLVVALKKNKDTTKCEGRSWT
jgi:hypothetical protein